MAEVIESIKEWVIHLFNPHCVRCYKSCESCELLRRLLDAERFEKKRLLDLLVNGPEITQVEEKQEIFQPIHSGTLSRRALKNKLEREARERYEKIKKERGLENVWINGSSNQGFNESRQEETHDEIIVTDG